MPDISKINAVAVADIEKLDSILAANIEKVNGLTFATAEPGAAAAYSVRLLDSLLGTTYTGVAMRIRRDTGTGNTGNDDEADVAFDSGVISLDSAVSNFSAGGSNATTLGQFLNVGTVNGTAYTDADSLSPNTAAAYVDEWKDQSGNANHAEQSTPANQPQIHIGTVDTDLILENGKPTIENVTNGVLETSNFDGDDGPVSVFTVRNATVSGNTTGVIVDHSTSISFSSSLGFRHDTSQNKLRFGTNSNFTTVAESFPTGQNLHSGIANSTGRDIYIDGVSVANTSGNQETTGVTSRPLSVFGLTYSNIVPFAGNIQEVVVYTGLSGDQSSNRASIEENINSDYLIYQPTDQPTSGLLYDYGSATGGTDAAAAYSVRQLSDKAVICMRIRRDMGAGNPGDDDEINIGFDSNGDLDTQAIADFCTTGTGYVTRWWDQSVNGNHADQQTKGFEPQIYNGTAVIEENGKPAIQYTQSSNSTLITVSNIGISGTGDRTNFVVAECDNISGTTESTVFSYGGASSGEAWQNTFEPWIRVGSGYQSFSGTTSNTQHLLTTALWSGTNVTDSDMFVDGSAATAGAAASRALNTTNSTLKIGSGATAAPSFSGTTQEILIWSSNESSNRSGIETNIDTYYQIPGM